MIINNAVITALEKAIRILVEKTSKGATFPMSLWITDSYRRKKMVLSEISRIGKVLEINSNDISVDLKGLHLLENELAKFCTNMLLINDFYVFLTAFLLEVINNECGFEYISSKSGHSDVQFLANTPDGKNNIISNFSHTYLIQCLFNTGFSSQKLSQIAFRCVSDFLSYQDDKKKVIRINHEDNDLLF